VTDRLIKQMTRDYHRTGTRLRTDIVSISGAVLAPQAGRL
jgi:hypothetical protein